MNQANIGGVGGTSRGRHEARGDIVGKKGSRVGKTQGGAPIKNYRRVARFKCYRVKHAFDGGQCGEWKGTLMRPVGEPSTARHSSRE